MLPFRLLPLLGLLLLLLGPQTPAAAQQPAASPLTGPLAKVLPRAEVLADLTLFQQIKEAAHAGIYKYRTKARMDSAFAAARAQVPQQPTVLDEFRLIAAVTDFEGSVHNDTKLPAEAWKAIGPYPVFFPYPLKMIAGKMRFNYAGADIPLGAEILTINGRSADSVAAALSKYWTVDGYDRGIRTAAVDNYIARYYFYEYGPQRAFDLTYRPPASPAVLSAQVPAVTYNQHFTNRKHRHSRPFDSLTSYSGQGPRYSFRTIGSTAVLTVRTFDIGGNAESPLHKKYVRFLDSVFTKTNADPTIASVLVDVRGNDGGSDPNDMVTFSYLAHQPFQENKSAFLAFNTIPYWKYIALDGFLKRLISKFIYQRELRREFTVERDGKYYQNQKVNVVYQPAANRTTKPVYLLVDSYVASAASMFSAMVRGNTEAVVIGEETVGGYYGHTGHAPASFILPHSGIQTGFSVVDLEQDVPVKASQPAGRGILPDYPVSQSYEDFLANRDTQLAFALDLIKRHDGKAATNPLAPVR